MEITRYSDRDETWIHHRQTGRKPLNACWIVQDQSSETVIRRHQQEPKILFSKFFRSNGGIDST